MQVEKRLDYQVPKFQIECVDLIFDLVPEATIVTSQLSICRVDINSKDALILDGYER